MSKQTDLIEADIRSRRDALRSNALALQAKADSITDWRRHFERHTGALLVAAIGAGALLAAMGGRRRRRPSTASAASELAEDLGPTQPVARRQDGIARQIWDPVKDALIGAVVMHASGFLQEIVRGFPEQRTRDSSSRGESARSSGDTEGVPNRPREDSAPERGRHRGDEDARRRTDAPDRATRAAALTDEQETVDERG